MTGRPRDNEEYPDCKRCGHSISMLTTDMLCLDCRYYSAPHIPAAQRNYPDIPYTVTIFAPGTPQGWKNRPATVAIRDLQIRNTWINVEEDWVAHHYATDVLGHHEWPVITVTDGPDLLDHWEGHQPDRLTHWAPREQEVAA